MMILMLLRRGLSQNLVCLSLRKAVSTKTKPDVKHWWMIKAAKRFKKFNRDKSSATRSYPETTSYNPIQTKA